MPVREGIAYSVAAVLCIVNDSWVILGFSNVTSRAL